MNINIWLKREKEVFEMILSWNLVSCSFVVIHRYPVSKYLKKVRKGHIAIKAVSRSVEVMISLISSDISIIRILNLYVIYGENRFWFLQFNITDRQRAIACSWASQAGKPVWLISDSCLRVENYKLSDQIIRRRVD